MIDHSYWLKILPVLIALAIALIELWKARENKGRLHLWGVTTLYVAAFALTCRIIWNDQMEAPKLTNDDTARRNWVGGKIGNEDLTQNYVDTVRQLHQELIRKKTGTVIDRFFASEPEREKRRTQVEQLNAKALSGYKIRFQPLYDFVIAKFDYWIEEVKERGIAVDMKINEAVAVNVADRSTSFTIRTATFGNGDEVQLQFVPAVIEDGRIVQSLHFQMPFFRDGANTGEVWAMTVEERDYRVRNQKPTRFKYKDYQGSADNPIEDRNLIDVLNDSLDEVMSYVVAEATRESNRPHSQSADQSPPQQQ